VQDEPCISQDRLRLRVAARTDVGRLRADNEDRFAIDLGLGLVVVADGIGGHASGEVAAMLAVEAVVDAYASILGDVALRLEHALLAANRRIFDVASRDDRLFKMGTTCVAVALHGSDLAIAHAGDSRAYRWRDGVLDRLTRDHSFLEEVAVDLRDARRYNSNAITRALGLKPAVDVALGLHRPAPGDRYLLCTDGLTNMLPDATICRVLTEHADLEQTCNELVRLANAAGGRDNITVAVLEPV
jgi:serine/threonine protein phosphatase PrpC